MNKSLRGEGAIEELDGDCHPQYGRVVGDDDDDDFPPGGGNHRHRHYQQLSHLWKGYLHQHLQQHHIISNPSSSLVFNLVTGTIDWCLWVTSSVDYIL